MNLTDNDGVNHSNQQFSKVGKGSDQSIKPPSMTSLIRWNINKVLKINPNLDLKEALRSTCEKLENGSYEASSTDPNHQERHLTCAVLAWQALGNTDITALYKLLDTSKSKQNLGDDFIHNGLNNNGTEKNENYRRCIDSLGGSYYSDVSANSRPTAKLHHDTKLILHCGSNKGTNQSNQKSTKDVEKKIEAACCPDTSCAERLAEFDSAVEALRARAARLARREADRAELLERAETAWRDLETGYQRRLQVLQEKEDDINRQIKDLVKERNGYKRACASIAEFLQERGSITEKECQRLNATEKELCGSACERHLLAEEVTRADNMLGEQHCRSTQQERDLQFKEEKLRRTVASLKSSLELQRALALESERAVRAELVSLREQGQNATEEVLRLQTENAVLQQHCDELKTLNEDLISDLEGCKVRCDQGMQKKVDELKKKTMHLTELKQKVIECRCMAPVETSVQVKRTPSLAALCRCAPGADEDDCSCTSLRTKLLNDVLEGLFSGLHEEMADCTLTMPCILLKCLEDSHDWERASVIRTRLTDYFSKLLVNELDIAIENCIERYHAKWVGALCKPDSKDVPVQPDTMVYNVHELKTNFIGQMYPYQFETPERENIIRPLKTSISTATFAVQYPSRPTVDVPLANPDKVGTLSGASNYWRRTHQNVTQLRVEIEDLKKEAIKKEDLKLMQYQLSKIMQKATNIVRITSTNVPNNSNEQKILDASPKQQDVMPAQIDNKDMIPKRMKKPSESLTIQKKINNKTDITPKVLGQRLNTKTVRNTQAPRNSYRYNYPQSFIFGKETKSTSMENERHDNGGTSLKSNKIVLTKSNTNNESLEIENNTPEIQKIHDKNSAHQSSKSPSKIAFDKLLEHLMQWKDSVNVSNATNKQNLHASKKEDEKNISVLLDTKNKDKILNTDYTAQNTHMSKQVTSYIKKAEEEDLAHTPVKNSSLKISFSQHNVQLSLISEKCSTKSKKITEQNSDFQNVLSTTSTTKDHEPTNKVDRFNVSKKKTPSSSPKSDYIYNSKETKHENAVFENMSQKLQNTDIVVNLISHLSKDLMSPEPPSITHTMIDDLPSLLVTTKCEKDSTKILDSRMRDRFMNSAEEKDLDNKVLKTTFMKKVYSYESHSCTSCTNKYSEEITKLLQASPCKEEIKCDTASVKPPKTKNKEVSNDISYTFTKTRNNTSPTNTYRHQKKADSPTDSQRVQNLLHKYLTTKIKRVHRISETEPLTNTTDKNFPNLLSQLYNLIEDDFDKLNGSSKCDKKALKNSYEISTKNNKQSRAVDVKTMTITTSSQVSAEFEIEKKNFIHFTPIKLNNDSDEIPIYDCKKVYVSCACSPTVSDRQCSCNILKDILSEKKKNEITVNIKDTINTCETQNQLTRKTFPRRFINAAKSEQIIYRNNLSIYKEKTFDLVTVPNLEIQESTNMWSNVKKMKMSNVVENQIVDVNILSSFGLPCFGCTIECTCDKSLGPCVCTKGILIKKKDEIEKIWNMAVKNKQNTSTNYDLYVSGNHKRSENIDIKPSRQSRKDLDSSNSTLSHSDNECKICEITSMNNLFIPTDTQSNLSNAQRKKQTTCGERDESEGLCTECENQTSLSESCCSIHTILPNLDMGRRSTNTSLPDGQNISST